ncbi:gluconate transport inducer 1/Pac2 [Lobosporangium transversale]|uniref:Gluconate transport inducer 1/Pac2 n=1 Tax=Lobosporangium transversale TaxID=64571 RepID=A0A1Y2GA70_9FUNG|nr:gluconate transport inducer 1/Pac2 [Lobosporangium transversale]ORZ05337.1 gluconate transport inducer 1/Pac2 [Lobosporangium transversale]|eukprot:XP_021877029.1 gluconate transport inducer 1/Pac2 [Lobosporangium transversale]
MLIKDPWSYFSTLPWLSLGQIRDTLDALIIFEACRQGVLPRITRRLLAAERASLPDPTLIVPGSVFVFDESESGICRWTDGRIWSPSRINGNFLVYKELFRKLSNEKCTSTADKERMRTGSGLTDEALRAKIEKDNLVVQGSSKGTFVLKKNGLIKKTICVRGVNALSLQELKDRYERSTQSCSNACSRRISSPHFSVTGTQHLVCYEREGRL